MDLYLGPNGVPGYTCVLGPNYMDPGLNGVHGYTLQMYLYSGT